MRKIKNLAILLFLFALNSCSKPDDSTLIYDSRTVSQNKDIEYVTIEQKGLSNGNEELAYSFSWIDVKILEIKNNKLDYNTIFFLKGNKSLESRVYIKKISNGNRNVKFKNLKGELLFSFTLDNKSIYTNFQDGIFIDELNKTFAVSNSNYSSLADPKYNPMTDCGTFKYKECMICGNDVCDQDWRCDLARTATGPAFVAGLAITCGIRQLTNELVE
jgi:hypothetical protein